MASFFLVERSGKIEEILIGTRYILDNLLYFPKLYCNTNSDPHIGKGGKITVMFLNMNFCLELSYRMLFILFCPKTGMPTATTSTNSNMSKNS